MIVNPVVSDLSQLCNKLVSRDIPADDWRGERQDIGHRYPEALPLVAEVIGQRSAKTKSAGRSRIVKRPTEAYRRLCVPSLQVFPATIRRDAPALVETFEEVVEFVIFGGGEFDDFVILDIVNDFNFSGG